MGEELHDLNVIRDDIRLAHKHLRDAVLWARAHPENPTSAINCLLANADEALDVLQDAGTFIWQIENAIVNDELRKLEETPEVSE